MEFVRLVIDDFQYAMHGLPQGYIGNPDNDLTDAIDAERVCAGIHHEADRTRWLEALKNARSVIESFIAFKASTSDLNFENWAGRNGRPCRCEVAVHPWRRELMDIPAV